MSKTYAHREIPVDTKKKIAIGCVQQIHNIDELLYYLDFWNTENTGLFSNQYLNLVIQFKNGTVNSDYNFMFLAV